MLIAVISCIVLHSCEKEESDYLELSNVSFTNISSEGAILEVNVNCTSDWSVTQIPEWCEYHKQNNQKLILKIDENLKDAIRSATVTVSTSTGNASKNIELSQVSFNPENYLYKLPVIFHVLYHDRNDNNQYVETGRLPEILEQVNKLYHNTGTGSANMELEFVLATKDPKGNILPEPGVERIKWESEAIDIEQFMFTNDRTYNYLIWEPNDYINIMVYRFTNDNIMGVSHFPYSPETEPLDGTETVSSRLTGDNLRYAYCISINNLYIYEKTTGTLPNPNDAAITLGHELGHYLGLYHTFAEATEDGVDVCEDTDYCADTYTYDRQAYENWIYSLDEPPYTFAELAQRHDCVRNTDFTSRNIMDYAYSYLDQFTAQQKLRVRHVLTYSPLIPGPKKGLVSTRSVHNGLLDLPIRVMK